MGAKFLEIGAQMIKQIQLQKAVPLLASYGWDDKFFAPSTHPESKHSSVQHKRLQSRRWEVVNAIDKDFSELMQFVSPSEDNLSCHSSRISALLVRVCIELESCFKSVLAENASLQNSNRTNIRDYEAIERSHSLSSYSFRIHGWWQEDKVFNPFSEWRSPDASQQSLPWYTAYGRTKHNILDANKYATFEILCLALGGLHIALVSQFGTNFWGPNRSGASWAYDPEFECVIGDNIEVRLPPKIECRVVYDLPRSWDYRIGKYDYCS